MTTPNAELAYKVLDQIDAHPEQWNQAHWWQTSPTCGTAGCFAGWAVQLSGGRMERDQYAHVVVVKSGLGDLDGKYVPVAAAALLGLPIDESEDEDEAAENLPLFDESNDREDLGRLVAEVFGPRPASKPSLDRDPVEAAIYDGIPPNAGSAD